MENFKTGMPTIEELQGIVSGLTAVVKQQAEALKATNAQIAQLTEALIAHGGPPRLVQRLQLRTLLSECLPYSYPNFGTTTAVTTT